MLDGVNDSTAHAAELAEFLKPLIVDDGIKVRTNWLAGQCSTAHPRKNCGVGVEGSLGEGERRGVVGGRWYTIYVLNIILLALLVCRGGGGAGVGGDYGGRSA